MPFSLLSQLLILHPGEVQLSFLYMSLSEACNIYGIDATDVNVLNGKCTYGDILIQCLTWGMANSKFNDLIKDYEHGGLCLSLVFFTALVRSISFKRSFYLNITILNISKFMSAFI